MLCKTSSERNLTNHICELVDHRLQRAIDHRLEHHRDLDVDLDEELASAIIYRDDIHRERHRHRCADTFERDESRRLDLIELESQGAGGACGEADRISGDGDLLEHFALLLRDFILGDISDEIAKAFEIGEFIEHYIRRIRDAGFSTFICSHI